MGGEQPLLVEGDAEARRVRQGDLAADDAQRLLGEPLQALLPDPVRVQGVVRSGRRRAAVGDHGQRDVEVVVGVAPPRQAHCVAQLGDAHRAPHGPEVRVGERDGHRLQGERVGELPPVGGDHVGGGGQSGGAAELGEYLPPRVAALGAAGVLGVGEGAHQGRAQLDGLAQRPGAVGVESDPGVGEALLEGADRGDLLPAGQHPALELEVLEAVAPFGGLGQAHDRLRGERLLVAKPVPVVLGVGLADVVAAGAVGVADVEEVAEDADGVALLAVAEQGGDRYLQVLAEQVQEGGLHGGDGVHGGAQVEGLGAAAAGVPVTEADTDLAQHPLVVGHRGAQDEGRGVPQRPGDGLAAGDLAQTGAPLGVGEDDDVPGEVGGVGAGEVQLHAVPAGDRVDGEVGDGGAAHSGAPWWCGAGGHTPAPPPADVRPRRRGRGLTDRRR